MIWIWWKAYVNGIDESEASRLKPKHLTAILDVPSKAQSNNVLSFSLPKKNKQTNEADKRERRTLLHVKPHQLPPR